MGLLLLAGGLFSTMLGVRAELAGLPTTITGLIAAVVLPGIRRRFAISR